MARSGAVTERPRPNGIPFRLSAPRARLHIWLLTAGACILAIAAVLYAVWVSVETESASAGQAANTRLVDMLPLASIIAALFLVGAVAIGVIGSFATSLRGLLHVLRFQATTLVGAGVTFMFSTSSAEGGVLLSVLAILLLVMAPVPLLYATLALIKLDDEPATSPPEPRSTTSAPQPQVVTTTVAPERTQRRTRADVAALCIATVLPLLGVLAMALIPRRKT